MRWTMAGYKQLLQAAQAELGVMESPAGSNCVKYNTAYYGRKVYDTVAAQYPWCVTFIWWLFQKVGAPELFYGGGKTASCGTLMDYAKMHGLFVSGGYQPGDLVFFRFSGRGGPQHVGIVKEVRANQDLVTIEGNTGMGNDTNGGQVQQQVRAAALAVGGYRPLYDKEEELVTYPKLRDIPEKFRPIVERLMDAGIIQGDGSDPTGNEDVINLTHEQVRTLVFVYRGGGFDRQLLAAGLEPAVKT